MAMWTRPLQRHLALVSQLQEQIRKGHAQQKLLSFHYHGHSHTTRSKKYNRGCSTLSCGRLNQVLSIDIAKKRVRVEPRVTIETLVRATLPLGLAPPIVPEFKGITVGGAIMGSAAESTSHRWGIFHDSCTEVELLDGRGNLLRASPHENADLFYGISGSYGSLGLLISAEIALIPIQQTVRLNYHIFSDPLIALKKMEALIGTSDFLDGILFAKDHAVIIEGMMVAEPSNPSPSEWYAHHVKKISQNSEEKIPLFDYFFRYDQGAFWMGSLLFSLRFLTRYIGQGLFKMKSSQKWFTHQEIENFKNLKFPCALAQSLTHPLMHSQCLWGLLHKAEKWVQDRLIIQDCCIPLPDASLFLTEICDDPGLFPIWLCPLKGTNTQLFAPHQGHPYFINFGLYGVPSYSAPMEQMIKHLEHKTQTYGGRKVLYSCSYYTKEIFWQIYSQEEYERLRKQMHAKGIWPELTEKVLSQ